MKVIAFAGSNSSTSINKQLVEFAASYFKDDEVEVLDINDYEMSIFSLDREHVDGIPKLAHDFSSKLGEADLILISLAEYNGSYSSAFKNILDWVSRIPKKSVFQDRPIFLMATSPGPRGASIVLEAGKNRFPWNGGKVLDTFSLPSFGETFDQKKGIVNDLLREELERKINKIKLELSSN